MADQQPIDIGADADQVGGDQVSHSANAGLPVIYSGHSPPNETMNLAIAAWLHAKFQRSRSAKTKTTYSAILQAYRALLQARGLDLDAADPRRIMDVAGGDASTALLADLAAERTRTLALAAQAYAVQPARTRYGERPVAASTANLRLAAISSFYRYALRHDFLRGDNPVARVERLMVQSYAAARPIAYEELRARLAVIDLTTSAGLRDYALLLLGLHTGRRLSELAGLRREHIVIRASRVEITWVRCKGGKTMRDELPRRGAQGLAGEALVAWLMRLYGEDGVAEPLLSSVLSHDALDRFGRRGGQLSGGRTPAEPDDDSRLLATAAGERSVSNWFAERERRERPVWISLATRNGTFGHPLSIRAIAQINEQRLGASKVHTLRHTFARGLEDAGAKVSEIQARLGHADLGTTGRYLAQLRSGENPHLARLSHLYGLDDRLKNQPPPATPDEE